MSGDVVLVVHPSAPVRGRLIRFLRNRQFNAHEAVGVDDALYYLTRTGIPSSLVVAHRLGQESGVGLVSGLTKIERLKHVPMVIVVDDASTLALVTEADFPPTVVAVISDGDVAALVSAILSAHEKANNEVPEEFREARKSSQESSKIEIENKSLDKIEVALSALNDVLKRVANGKLPGPMMPAVLQEVRDLTSRKDLEFKDVGELVNRHQSLSSKLLSVANSAFYSRSGGKAKDIMQALSRLGLNKTLPLLQALAAKEYIVGKNKLLRKRISESLRTAYVVGVISQELAAFEGHKDPSLVYSVGLFHNIGGTFLLYTIALLNDQGTIEMPNSKALVMLMDSHASKLNGAVAEGMNLPREVGQVFEESEDEPPAIIRHIHQAIYLRDKLSNPDVPNIRLDAEGEMIGLNDRLIDFMNDKREYLQGLVSAYSK
mgnify:CR=1 FL=1